MIPRKAAISCVQIQALKNVIWEDYLELEKPLRCFNGARVCLFPPSALGTDVQGHSSSSAPGEEGTACRSAAGGTGKLLRQHNGLNCGAHKDRGVSPGGNLGRGFGYKISAGKLDALKQTKPKPKLFSLQTHGRDEGKTSETQTVFTHLICICVLK